MVARRQSLDKGVGGTVDGGMRGEEDADVLCRGRFWRVWEGSVRMAIG